MGKLLVWTKQCFDVPLVIHLSDHTSVRFTIFKLTTVIFVFNLIIVLCLIFSPRGSGFGDSNREVELEKYPE